MSELSKEAWPFSEISDSEGLDIAAIFDGAAPQPRQNLTGAPDASTDEREEVPASENSSSVLAASELTANPTVSERPKPQLAVNQAAAEMPSVSPAARQTEAKSGDNPLAAAFDQKIAENAKAGLFEKLPIFSHKGARETVEDTSMTFEELRIRKVDDFADLEDGKRVTWKVKYGSITKEVKDPKSTTIKAIKEAIERSKEFLDALKRAKDKSPDCLLVPEVVMRTKGIASYRGHFATLEEARMSDKVICVIPSGDGKLYELRKMEEGEFIAPANKVAEFPYVQAGFTPSLPRIPLSLIGQIVAFFRSFVSEQEEYEALAHIFWDKKEQRFFAYIPPQTVSKDDIVADLRSCPYQEPRYLRYADIHSHNTMKAFFSHRDNLDETGTGLYFVVGHLDSFLPELKARISCGGSFVEIDPENVIEGLGQEFPEEWNRQVHLKKSHAVFSLSEAEREGMAA